MQGASEEWLRSSELKRMVFTSGALKAGGGKQRMHEVASENLLTA